MYRPGLDYFLSVDKIEIENFFPPKWERDEREKERVIVIRMKVTHNKGLQKHVNILFRFNNKT